MASALACTRSNPAYLVSAGLGADGRPAPPGAGNDGQPSSAERQIPAPDANELSQGLAAYWPLDEGTGLMAADVTGRGNAGALVNGPTWVTAACARTNFVNRACLRFDGINDHVAIEVGALPATEAAKSITLWFSPSSTGGIIRKTIVALSGRTGMSGLSVGIDRASGAMWQWGSPTILRTAAVAENTWHHLAYTHDGAAHRIYLDGALAALSMAAAQTGPTETGFISSYNGVSEMYAGQIDELRIYARALTGSEVAALARGEGGP